MGLRDRIRFRYPPHSAFPNHVHRFNPLQRPPRRGKRPVTFRQLRPLLHRAMVLFNDVVEILALPQTDSTRQDAFHFQRFDCGRKSRVLVHVDDPWHGIARGTQGLTEEAFGRRRIPLGREQKLDSLAS